MLPNSSLFALCRNHRGQTLKQTRTVHPNESLLGHVLRGRKEAEMLGSSRYGWYPNQILHVPLRWTLSKELWHEHRDDSADVWTLVQGGRNKFKARDRYTECSREALQMWIKGDSDRLYIPS